MFIWTDNTTHLSQSGYKSSASKRFISFVTWKVLNNIITNQPHLQDQ